jgi:hypothetical protein
MHCSAMKSTTAEMFTSTTSRDPVDGALVAVTSDGG